MNRIVNLKLTEQELKVLIRTMESMIVKDEDLAVLQSVKELMWGHLTIVPNDIGAFNRWVDVQQRKLEEHKKDTTVSTVKNNDHVVFQKTETELSKDDFVNEEDLRIFEALDAVGGQYPRSHVKNRRNRRRKNK